MEEHGHLEVQDGVQEDDGFVQTLYQCSLCHQVYRYGNNKLNLNISRLEYYRLESHQL